VLLFLLIAGVPVAALVAALCWTLLNIMLAGRPRAATPADAIAVFGAEATPHGPCPELAARLDHAAELYRQGMAPAVLCCGGRSGTISEAASMAEFLLRSGLPAHAVLADEACPSTRSALAAIRRHATGRWNTVLLVSSPYHLHRIMSEARRWDVSAIGCPTGRTPVMVRLRPRTRQILREVAAIWWYAITAIGLAREMLAGTDPPCIRGVQPAAASRPVVPEAQ
jgi:vancomycin permeability regulator SanA